MGQFRFFTAGESHGKGLLAVVEGMVANLPLDSRSIDLELKRRQTGYGRGARMAIENDKVEILSGVRHGHTMGSPIALFIPNQDWQNWQKAMSCEPVEDMSDPITRPRPGHADLAGAIKYNFKDIRPVLERASARETAARVAVGAVAKEFLKAFGIAIHSYTVAVGICASKEQDLSQIDWQQVENSPLRCADNKAEKFMLAVIDETKAQGDTLGGISRIIATGMPPGLGSHVQWDRRLDGNIARAMMSINAVKGIEIGTGFAQAGLKGSQVHDTIASAEPGAIRKLGEFPWRHLSNHAGGIEGGISNGEDIIFQIAIKPIATLAKPLSSLDLRDGSQVEAHYERSDICVVPATGVIAEAMLAIILADACLDKFGGDSLSESMANYRKYLESISLWKRHD